MATHAIGKLKFNLSGQGLAYRWGDGEIKRLFGRKAKADGDDNENYSEYADGEGYDDPGYGDAYEDDYAAEQDYADDPGYDDGYDDGDGYDDPGYDDGGYDDDGYDDDGYDDDGYDDDGYADDGYADDGYADDGYADDGYDDDGYADDGYDDDGYADDGYADDGYDDDGYDDDGYADDGYDDRYSDEDAGDGYDDGYYPNQSPLMQYVDENDWVTYLLLFLFPPLGIYLLWRRNRFEKPIRYAISAASAVWFIVALILIFTGIFGGRQDNPLEGIVTLPPSATVAPASTADAQDGVADVSDLTGGITASDIPDDGADASDLTDEGSSGAADVAPSPTPLADSAASAALNTSDYVYSPATGLYYHNRTDCTNIDEGVSVSRVPKEVAENNRKQSACPVCIGGGSGDTTTYYATRGGTYYHVDQHCSGMTGAVTYTKEAAERAGKTACPVCILKTQQSVASGALKFVTNSTSDKSNISVYYTKGGKYYHLLSDCSGMTGAGRHSLKDALLGGKKACPTCCATAGTSVYCTNGGTYYHLDKTCKGMTGAAEVTLAEAMVLGKKRCPVCIKNKLPTASDIASAASAGTDGTAASSSSSSGEVYVYGTPKGKYYHTNSTCSGMSNAQRYTLKSMLQQNRAACPVCASSANTVVYATEGGTYYHSYATCSGMTNATSGTMAQALAYGYKRCPRCWSSTSSASTTSASASSGSVPAAASTATARNTYVYATRGGAYYHLKSNCSGMKDPSRVTLKQAIDAGKTACPTCAGSANRTVYSTDGGKYYHAASTCEQSGMKNGEARTLASALMLNQTACQYCMRKTSRRSETGGSSGATAVSTKNGVTTVTTASGETVKLTNSHTYRSGASGIKVYATATSKHYHRNSTCSGMTNASHISLETALNYGKTACPKCASSASRTVYATRGGKYYHNSKTHAGTGAKSGSLDSALAYGYEACPYCVTKTKTLSHTNTYKSGTSGIKVYATATSKHYHSNSTCSGMKNASHITLETALNYGKTACPTCLASAAKKVYSSSGDSYYHYYKAHAGSSARAGTLAQAKALGKKVCPQCSKGLSTGISTTGSTSYSKATTSTKTYSASGSTKVYIDLTGAKYFYYHKSSRCSGAGMSGGTKITLQYAKDWGYKACPYCNPPTSISEDT